MTSFGLKIIALISMLCDHVSYVILDTPNYLNIIGRIAFPIFAFQISEGYAHTKNLKKYILRLFIFAIISQIPFTLFLYSLGINDFSFNVFFTLLLGLLSITIYDKIKDKYNKYLGFIPVIALIILAQILKCDYGWYGVTLIFLFYLFKENRLLMNISAISLIFIKYLITFTNEPHIYYLYFILGAITSLIFINLYNNKKGKNIKHFLYVFYPLHLLILALIKMYILN